MTGQGSKSAVFANVPSLSFDASYIAALSYTGINVDIRTPNLIDATGVEITVDRTNGDPDVWVSNPDSAVSTSVVDALNGTNHKTTAPIVIVEGSRTRTSSRSWSSSARWRCPRAGSPRAAASWP